MPDEADANQSPVAEAAPPAAPSPPSEPTDAPASPGYRRFDFGRAVGLPDEAATALNEERPEQPKTETSGEPGEPPSPDGSKPDTAPTPDPASAEESKPSRRQTAEEANKARIAELEAELARVKSGNEPPSDPAALREVIRTELLAEQKAEADRAAQEAMSATQRAEIDRFEAACRMADSDPRLNEPVPGTDLTLYQWREQRKETMALFPEAEAHFKAEAARVINEAVEAERQTIAAREQQFRTDMVKQLDETASLPHVDPKPWATPGTTWAQMGRDLHAAGAAWKEAELAPQIAERDARIAALEEQVRDLGLVGPRGLGSSRAPVASGRSAGANPGPAPFDETRHWRANLGDALMGANGSR